MTGIILAAGAGTRLNGRDAIRPKCAIPFGGTPLLEYQLRALKACGVNDVAIVVGFEAERVRRMCGPAVKFVDNPEYQRTNSLYSLWLARPLLTDGFVVLNCDVLFHPVLLEDLLTARHDDALLVSYPRAGDPPFGDEEMKAHVRRGQIVDLRKDLPPHLTDGENVGIARFSAAGAARLIPLMERRLADGLRDWAPRAFADFAREKPLHAIGTRGLPWTEIDTPEDYQHASAVVFPAIKSAVDELTPALRRGA